MSQPLAALEKRLQHLFKDRTLLPRALIHRSFSAEHNERLEFLGDSVLNLAVSSLLFERLPNLAEGDLSRVRANLVKQDTLHQLAVALNMSDALRVGEGEARTGGKNRPSMLADALEAVIGAVYLDAGFDAASQLVGRLYSGVDINPQMQAVSKDSKTALQEWLQGRRLKLPVYRVSRTQGEAHKQQFHVECTVPEHSFSVQGCGPSRRAAEQAAAAAMLEQLEHSFP